MKEIFASSGSSRGWRTLSGFDAANSARPISSKTSATMTSRVLAGLPLTVELFSLSYISPALAKHAKILSDVVNSLPQKFTVWKYGPFEKYLDFCTTVGGNLNTLLRILTASDFEVPGFPQIRIGVLVIMHTQREKVFSRRAVLKAVPGCKTPSLARSNAKSCKAAFKISGKGFELQNLISFSIFFWRACLDSFVSSRNM